MEEWSNMDRGKMLVKSVAKLGNLEGGGRFGQGGGVGLGSSLALAL